MRSGAVAAFDYLAKVFRQDILYLVIEKAEQVVSNVKMLGVSRDSRSRSRVKINLNVSVEVSYTTVCNFMKAKEQFR